MTLNEIEQALKVSNATKNFDFVDN